MVIGFGKTLSKSSIFSKRAAYHGSYTGVVTPEIIIGDFTKDFGYGFYITDYEQQAIRFTNKFRDKRIINKYLINNISDLKSLIFTSMTEEWLDFIINCRRGIEHDYDLVEGPMADDQIWNHINDLLEGNIDREDFWKKARFSYPTHQIALCTERSLKCIEFIESYEV